MEHAAPPPPPPAPPAPPPPLPQADRRADEQDRGWYRPPQAGQLTVGWRVATSVVWALAFFGFVAVWKTSRELGLHTWWLGPIGDPVTPFVTMVPFVAPVVMIVLSVNNAKRLPWFGLAAAAVTALVAVFDIDNVVRLAIVEFAIAGAGGLTAVAGFSGQYRK